MKTIILSVIAFGAICTAQAQDFAQIAKQQIENHVKLPCEITIIAPHFLDSLQLNMITIQMTIRPNGRVKQLKTIFIHPSITPINDLFIDASKKIKLPQHAVPQIISVSCKLQFTELNDTPQYGAKHETMRDVNNVAYNAAHYNHGQNLVATGRTPNAKAIVISKQVLAQPTNGSVNPTAQRIRDIDEFSGTGMTLSRSKFGPGTPRYIVTLVKN